MRLVPFTQFLTPWVGVYLGKRDLTQGDPNEFAHDYRTQFLNLGLQYNLEPLRIVTYAPLGAGIVLVPVEGREPSVDAMHKEGNMLRSRTIVQRGPWSKASIVLLGALALTGCASSLAVRVPKAGPDVTCITPAPAHDVLVGVALSGGGSRAALFGAAGLEALGRMRAPGGGSVLEQMTYLSSVSGGSVAATYYASQKPPRQTPVLTPEGALMDDYQTFFIEITEKMGQDFESALFWRQLLAFRWLNSSLAARSLFEIMGERLLGPTTFGDLARREVRGDSLRLIVNTTLYNSGRRFALTTLPPDASHL